MGAALDASFARPEGGLNTYMDWFEGDGSVRDAQGRVFRVREYVRSRLVDCIEVTDPARFRELGARSRHEAA